jgi:copper chaperone
MITTAFQVTGMSCEHCVNAVSSELGGLAGVSAVAVDLVAGGVSLVTVTSTAPLAEDTVRATLDEAGGYAITASTSLHAGRKGQRNELAYFRSGDNTDNEN